MDDFLKMDIFFAVTTAVVTLCGIFGLVALFYLIRILHKVNYIAQNVREESDYIRDDISTLRDKIKSEGMKFKHISDFFSNIYGPRTSTRRHAKVDKEL